LNKTLSQFGFGVAEPDKPPIWVKELLEYLYYEQKCSWTKITKLLDIRYEKLQNIRDHWDWEYHDQNEFIAEREYHDRDLLIELHHEKKLSLTEIGRRFGVTGSAISYWCEKLGVVKINHNYGKKFKLSYTENHPYPALSLNRKTDGRSYIFEHQMVMLAQGASVHDVFSQTGYDIHHLNTHKCDNRPENLQLIPKTVHGRLSAGNSEKFDEGQVYDVIMFILRMGRFRTAKSGRDPEGSTGQCTSVGGYSES